MKKKIKRAIKRVFNIIKKPEMMILPGQLAYFFVLSIVPIITLIAYFASFINVSISTIMSFITSAFSSETAELFTPLVRSDVKSGVIILIIIGFIMASNGAHSMIVTSNTMYGIEHSPFIKRRLKAISMTLLFVLLFLFILLVPVFGDQILALIQSINPNTRLIGFYKIISIYLKGPVTWIIIFFIIKMVYTMAPDKIVSSKSCNIGSIFTTILWTIATYFYSYYANNIADYSLFFGSLANIVVLMLWIYILSYIFVIGMALNVESEKSLANIGIIKEAE